MITEDEEYTFTHGQCGALAAVIAQELGRPVNMLWGGTAPLHAVVSLPNGRYADIEGIHTREQLLLRWDATHISAVMPNPGETIRERMVRFGHDHDGDRCDFFYAERVAERLFSSWQG